MYYNVPVLWSGNRYYVLYVVVNLHKRYKILCFLIRFDWKKTVRVMWLFGYLSVFKRVF